jgi:hypothetical protein
MSLFFFRIDFLIAENMKALSKHHIQVVYLKVLQILLEVQIFSLAFTLLIAHYLPL